VSRILIVDDSRFARNRLKLIFERGGHEVVGDADCGDKALELFEKLRPDLVTLDYLMDGKNGEEVLHEIMAFDPDARVIMVSGSGDHNIERQLLEAGAKLFVTKLRSQEYFLNAVDRVMKA
jgi:two-component system chemotaxis response regulator CheY